MGTAYNEIQQYNNPFDGSVVSELLASTEESTWPVLGAPVKLEPVETFPFFAASREAIPLGLLLQKVREGRV